MVSLPAPCAATIGYKVRMQAWKKGGGNIVGK